MLGKDIREFQTTGSGENMKAGETEMDDWLVNKLQSGKTWEGPINCSRKTGDFVALNSRVIPVSNNSNRFEYFLFAGINKTSYQEKHYLSRVTVLRIRELLKIKEI